MQVTADGSASATGVPALGDVQVLVVGTAGHVEGSSLPDVPAAATSARAVRDTLVRWCGVPEKNATVLIDPADAAELRAAITTAAGRAGSTLILWYVGHGVIGPDRELHLATRATTGPAHEAVRLADVTADLQRLDVLFVLDCCYSDRATPHVTGRGALLASAGATEHTPAEHTVMTGAALELLRGGDPRCPRLLTLRVIHEHLARELGRRGRPVPRLQLRNHLGNLVFTANRAYRDVDPARVLDDERSPFLGLDAYAEDDADVFFGRAGLTARLIARLGRAAGSGGLCVTIGPSGSGKSSVLHAGVLPALRKGALPGSESWRYASMTPGADPLGTLAGTLRDLADAAPSNGRRLVLIVDQFEELFTQGAGPEVRGTFVAALQEAATTTRALVLLSVRSDFHGPCTELPILAEALADDQVVAGPMTTAGLRAAIGEPAALRNLTLQDGLIEVLLRDVGADPRREDAVVPDAGVLPYLSYALLRTWQERDGRMLTTHGYAATGGVRGAIGRAAEQMYEHLDPAGRLAVHLLMLGMTTAPGGTVTRRPLPLAAALGIGRDPLAARRALDALTGARLVSADTGQVRIVHEALLTSWPRLGEWLRADRDGTRRAVGEAAAAWKHGNTDASLLFRGRRLAEAREWSALHEKDLSADMHDFLRVSRRRERRGVLARRFALVTLAALTLLTGTGAVVATRQRTEAVRQRDDAVTTTIAAQADRLRGTDDSLAARLDLVLHQRRPTATTRSRLINAENALLAQPLRGHTRAVLASAFAPRGHVLATAGADRTVRLWDTTDPDRPAPLGEPLRYPGEVRSLRFDPSGKVLAGSASDGSVRLWNLADPAHVTPFGPGWKAHDAAASSVSFSANGKVLASGGADRTLRFWDVADPAHPVALGAPQRTAAPVEAVAFQPGSSRLATGGDGGLIQLWNVTDPGRPKRIGTPLTGHTAGITGLSFHPTLPVLASSALDGTVRLWNLAVPKRAEALGAPLPGPAAGFGAVTFDPGGTRLAAAGLDGRTALWNTTDPRSPSALVDPAPASRAGAGRTAAFSPDGTSLVTAGDDATAYLWRFPETPAGGTVPGGGTALAVSPDGRLTATADRSGRIALTDPRGSRFAVIPGAHLNEINSLAFHPAEPVLASSGLDGEIRLWNLADPAHPARLGPAVNAGTHDNRSALAFSPDGRLLAAGTSKEIRLWDVSRPARPVPVGVPLSDQASGYLALAFSPDSRLLAATTADKTIELWDVDLRIPRGRPLTGHTAPVTAVTFSPDGHTLATGATDHTVRLWDVTDPDTAQPLGEPLTGHTATVTRLLFTPDGRTLTSIADAQPRVWNLDPRAGAARICRTTTGTLTESTWHTLIPDAPYQDPCP
ncbi:nSTAND1 domain-containing NTPase [Actinoplanes palleronii]|uniref:Novel STAND NTPase 1 domain-containing protein n=1 Tax=Actinoplanes palleronii TaxID=113570 RepID=A0ABQ4BI63_9ACTN|nr:hypothetical protein [Actinoplanes palleronii]GIE70352.1 hypothetical protein Apa02nite_064600 [Actinoplanes palleronii]